MSTAHKRNLIALLLGVPFLPLFELRAQTSGKRKQFAYVLRVAPRFHDSGAWGERESAIAARHLERLARASETGQVILAGRTAEPLSTTFGVVIFEADDAGAATAFMEADPAVQAGLMTATLHPYTVALQRKAAAL